jgi:hypothetical protein
VQEFGGGASTSAASLLFAPGDRPGAEHVRALARLDTTFVISLEPPEDSTAQSGAAAQAVRWLELLANGLTFDLEGLTPGESQPLPSRGYAYGLPAAFPQGPLEAISLRPGPHIAAGGRMLPVVRGTAWLAARLAALPNVRAVAWHPARTWSGPQHFRDSVGRWVEGGAFPGLGLTALAPTPEGGLQSEGLALFTGQELRLEPRLVSDRAAGARLALRLLHWLVETGRLEQQEALAGPSGESLLLMPSANGRFVDARLA